MENPDNSTPHTHTDHLESFRAAFNETGDHTEIARLLENLEDQGLGTALMWSTDIHGVSPEVAHVTGLASSIDRKDTKKLGHALPLNLNGTSHLVIGMDGQMYIIENKYDYSGLSELFSQTSIDLDDHFKFPNYGREYLGIIQEKIDKGNLGEVLKLMTSFSSYKSSDNPRDHEAILSSLDLAIKVAQEFKEKKAKLAEVQKSKLLGTLRKLTGQ